MRSRAHPKNENEVRTNKKSSRRNLDHDVRMEAVAQEEATINMYLIYCVHSRLELKFEIDGTRNVDYGLAAHNM